MTTAVVLIEAERDALQTLGGQLADLDGVAEAYSVTGEWDFVAIIRVPRHEMLADVVTGELVKLPGVSRTRRIDVGAFQELGGKMARPTRAIPALQPARGGGIVEHQARVVAVDGVIEAVQFLVGIVVEVDHHDVGAGGLDLIGAERRHGAFVHDTRAQFHQGHAQLGAKFLVPEQQGYGDAAVSHALPRARR